MRNRFALRLLAFIFVPAMLHAPAGRADPSKASVAFFADYTASLEARLARQHASTATFLVAIDSQSRQRLLRQGGLLLDNLRPDGEPTLPGALLHHWRGTAFAPGATASDLEHLVADYDAYPRRFSPQVIQAHVLEREGSRVLGWMRIRQQHGLTVVLDMTSETRFGYLDAQHRYSISHSTQIFEVSAPGTRHEHALKSGEEHGFLWRMNTYWTCEEGDGGLYMQIESVSLTRSVPSALRWAVAPLIESIPRDALDFTLRSACKAIRK